MITARSLVFYIRAEDQASRVIRRTARSFGSLANIKGLEQKIGQQQLVNNRNLEKAQFRIRKNQEAMDRAQITADRIGATRAAAADNAAVKAARNKADSISQGIRRNEESLLRAEAAASKLNRIPVGGAMKGYTAAETDKLRSAANSAVQTLGIQNGLLKAQGAIAQANIPKVMAEQEALRQGALSSVTSLNIQEKLLADNLDEVRRAGDAASASLDRQLSEAKIARTQSWINGFQGLARAIRLVGIVAAASLAFAAHSAAAFSTQTALAATQARPPGANINVTLQKQAQIQDVILKQMQKFPATSQDMANAFYQIFSGTNIQGVKQAAQYVTLFNKAAVGGGATLDEMVQAGLSIRNVFGVGISGEFKNMTQALNVFFSAVRYGRMTASQFAQALGYISPIAKDVQLSFRNIAEDMAFFTRQTGGTMTRQDAQGLARLIQLFARTDVTQGLAKKGIPVFDKVTKKMRPIVEILKQIHDQLHLTPQETVNFFKTISAAGSGKQGTQGTIQAIRIFSQGIQNAKAYQQVVSNVRADNSEFVRSYEAMSKSPGVHWQVFVNQMKAAAIVIGREAIPAIVQLSAVIVGPVHWFNSLSASTKHLIAQFAVYGSVAAVLGGTIIIVAGAALKLWLTFKLFRLEKLATEAGFFTVKMNVMLAALLAVTLILIKYPGLINRLVKAFGGFKGVLEAIVLFTSAFTLIKIVTAMKLVQGAALTAGIEVSALRGKLLALAAIGAITIPIIESVTRDSGPKTPGTSHTKYLGGPLGFIQKANDAINYAAARTLGESPRNAKEFSQWMDKTGFTLIPTKVKTIKTSDIPNKYWNELSAIIDNPYVSDAVVETAQKAFSNQDWGNLDKIYKGARKVEGLANRRNTTKNSLTRTTRNEPIITAQAQKTFEAASHDKVWKRLFDEVVRLDKISQNQPSIKNFTKLKNAQDRLQKNSKGNEFAAGMEFLSYLENTWPKGHTVAKKIWDRLFQNVVKLDKAVKAQKVPTLKSLMALQAAEDKLQKGSTTNQYSAAMEMLSALESTWNKTEKAADKHAKNMAKIAKRNAVNAKNEIQNLLQGVQSLYDTFLQQNQATFGDLFGGPVVTGARVQDNLQFGGHVTGQDLLKDIRAQNFQFARINKQYAMLGKRGASKKFLDAVRAQGLSAKDDIKALLTLSPSDFKKYLSAWNKGQTSIKAATNAQLNSQLKIYESHGRKIAMAILKGVQSQDQKLQGELERIIRRMFPGLAKQAQGHGGGIPNRISGSINLRPGIPNHVSHTYNYNIDSRDTPSITALKHLDFSRKNKFKGNQ